ncbi:MAG: OB-fold domain-containing protein [Thermodesulfobacteriota bacterium]
MQKAKPMTVLRCNACGSFSIPPRLFCPKCAHGVLEERETQGFGEIYSFTTIYVAPEIFKDQVPYDIALVELKEGVKVTARMKKPQDSRLEIGAPVRFCMKDATGYWFELESA